MARSKEPAVQAPWPPSRANDIEYRYPLVYPLGKRKGETLTGIAKRFALAPADLLNYNFQTTHEQEVNWYLLNDVKCKDPGPKRRYISFAGVKYVEGGTSGAIYVPRWGEPVADPANKLGEQVVKDYNASWEKRPGCACYDATYNRVSAALRKVGKETLPANNAPNEFACLFGSHNWRTEIWATLDEDYRGKGAAGAMAHQGLGTLVDKDGIWRGDLLPGAVIQVWHTSEDFEQVKAGNAAADIGHSFIFLNYVRTGAAITAMAIADNGYYHYHGVVAKPADWSYWVAANLVQNSSE